MSDHVSKNIHAGHTLTYVSTHEITTLEPTQVSGFADHTAALAIFGSLTFNFDGRTGKVGYYPYLAEDVMPLDDATWRIKVRENLRFHNGEPVDAHAVKYSFDRVLHPDFPSGRYLHTAPIERVSIVDNLTVDIHTRQPIAILPARLLRADGSLVAPGHYADEPPWRRTERTEFQPVGAGPYHFVSYAPAHKLVLGVNSAFIDPRGYERPNYNTLVIRFAPNLAAGLDELARGFADIVPITQEHVPEVGKIEGVRVVSGADTTRMSFEINQAAHPALRDKRVRQAINYAIDLDTLLAEHTGGEGLRLPSLVNPPNVHPELRPYPYDPARAQELLRQAGRGDGFDIDIHWSTSEDRGKLAHALVPYLENAGIRVRRVQHLDWGSEYQPRQKEGTLAGLHGHGHGGVEMTVETDLWPHHPHRPANSMNWRGPEADRFTSLYSELQSAVDPARQSSLGNELQEIVHQEAVAVMCWQTPRFVAVSERVRHYRPYPGGHNEDFWTVELAGD